MGLTIVARVTSLRVKSGEEKQDRENRMCPYFYNEGRAEFRTV